MVPYTKSPQNESNPCTSGKGHRFWFPKLQPDVSSPQMKMLGFDDSCHEGECSGSQKRGFLGTDGTDASQNITRTIDTL